MAQGKSKIIGISIKSTVVMGGFTKAATAIAKLKKSIEELNAVVLGGHQSRVSPEGDQFKNLSDQIDAVKQKHIALQNELKKTLEVNQKKVKQPVASGTQSFGGMQRQGRKDFKAMNADLDLATKKAADFEQQLDKALTTINKPAKGGTGFIRRRGKDSVVVSMETANKNIKAATEKRKAALAEGKRLFNVNKKTNTKQAKIREDAAKKSLADGKRLFDINDKTNKKQAKIREDAAKKIVVANKAASDAQALQRNKEQTLTDTEHHRAAQLASAEQEKIDIHNKTAKKMGKQYELTTKRIKKLGSARVKEIQREVQQVSKLIAKLDNEFLSKRVSKIRDPKVRVQDQFRQGVGVTNLNGGESKFIEISQKEMDLVNKYDLTHKKHLHTISKTRAFMGDIRNFMSMQVRWFASAAIIFAIPAAIGAALRSFAQFEQAIKDIGAVTGATERELDKLAFTAKQISAITPQSAVEIAKMARTLVQAGLEVDQVTKSMLTISKVATVSGESMDIVAKTFTTAIFAWKIAADESEKIGNVVAATLNFSRLQIEDLGTAYNYLASVAAQFNISFTETNAVLATFSNIGIRATTAGTSLVQAITQMTSRAPKKFKDFMGGSFEDISRIFESESPTKFADAIGLLEGKSLSAAKAMRLFELRAGRAIASALLIGSKAMKNMYERIDTAKQLTAGFNKAMEGTSNRLKVMKNQAQLLAIELGRVLEPVMNEIISLLRITLRVFTMFIKGISSNVGKLALLAAGIALVTRAVMGLSLSMKVLWKTFKAGKSSILSFIPVVGWVLGAVFAVTSLIGAFKESREQADLFGDKLKDAMDIVNKHGDATRKAAKSQKVLNKVWEQSGEAISRAVSGYSDAMDEFDFQSRRLPDSFIETDTAFLTEAQKFLRAKESTDGLAKAYEEGARTIGKSITKVKNAQEKLLTQDVLSQDYDPFKVMKKVNQEAINETKRQIAEIGKLLAGQQGDTQRAQAESELVALNSRLAAQEKKAKEVLKGAMSGLLETQSKIDELAARNNAEREAEDERHLAVVKANRAKLMKVLDNPRELFDALSLSGMAGFKVNPFERAEASFLAFTDAIRSTTDANFEDKYALIRQLGAAAAKDSGQTLDILKSDYLDFAQTLTDERFSEDPIKKIAIETRKSSEGIKNVLAFISENYQRFLDSPIVGAEKLTKMIKQLHVELGALGVSAEDQTSIAVLGDTEKIASANAELAKLTQNRESQLGFELAIVRAKQAQADIELKGKPLHDIQMSLYDEKAAAIEQQILAQDDLWLSFKLGAEQAEESWRSMSENIQALGESLVSNLRDATATFFKDMVSLSKYSQGEYENFTEYAKDVFDDFFKNIFDKWTSLLAEMYAEWLLNWIKMKAISMFAGGGGAALSTNTTPYTGQSYTGLTYLPEKHTGGMIGRDEIPFLGQTGEGVLSRRGMANLARLNGGGVSAQQQPITNQYFIQAMDAQSFNEYLRQNGQGAILGTVQEDLRLSGGTRAAIRSYA